LASGGYGIGVGIKSWAGIIGSAGGGESADYLLGKLY